MPGRPRRVCTGVVTAVMTAAFLVAIDRIPLGAAVAVEFLGPLTVAAVISPCSLERDAEDIPRIPPRHAHDSG